MTDLSIGETRRRFPFKWKSPVTAGLIILLIIAVVDLPNLEPIASFAATAFAGTLPYIAVAVFLIAYLKATGAETFIAKAFEGREIRMIFLAALFGGLAPFCSCEVIPFIAGLLAVGAPLSAVMAFWLSSPLIDPPTLLITAGALGWAFAISKAIAAVALGLLGGFAMKVLIAQGAFAEPLRKVEKKSCCGAPRLDDGKPFWAFWREETRIIAFRESLTENALFLAKWLALAYILEGLLITYVPAELIGSIVGGDGLLPIIIGALVGAPAYLNSYIAPPIVAGLMDQGMSNGAAMSFMVAGAVSSIPAMAAVWSLVKPPVFAAYFALGIMGAILFGSIFEVLVA